MYLIDSGMPICAAIAIRIGTIPPIMKMICHPYCGTSAAVTKPGMAPPTGTHPTAMIAGAVWAGIAGFLKATVGAHEVITTIMLNYIALNIIGWTVNDGGPLHGKTQAGPYSDPIPKEVSLPRIVPIAWTDVQTRLHLGIFIAVIAVPIVFVLLYRMRSGFGLRLLVKDARTAVTLARELGLSSRLGEAALALWEQAAEQLPADADHTEIATFAATPHDS